MKGLAITAMILGILAIVLPAISCGLLTPIGAILALLAIIFGAVSIAKYNKAGVTEGKGMATAGLVCGIISLVFVVIMFATCGLGFLGTAGMMSQY